MAVRPDIAPSVCTSHETAGVFQLTKSFPKEDNDHPDDDGHESQARFGNEMQVIAVRHGIAANHSWRLILSEDNGIGAGSGPEEGAVKGHGNSASPYGDA